MGAILDLMSELHNHIIKALEPMFKQADAEGLWFRSSYQDIWLSPDELRRYQADGKFVWGPINWELRNPIQLTMGIAAQIHELQQRLESIQRRIKGSQNA